MKTFYLVRHAQYANPRQILVGRLPVELSDEGIKEANKLAKFFADKKITKIYSSPVRRCEQTSQIIAQDQIPISYDLRIAETFSAYQGYWSKDLDWSHFYKHSETLGGEVPADIQQRMINFWDDIKDKNEGDVIICSHGDPLYLLYAHLTNLPTPDIKEIYEIREDEYQPKASIRKIISDQGKISIKTILKVEQL